MYYIHEYYNININNIFFVPSVISKSITSTKKNKEKHDFSIKKKIHNLETVAAQYIIAPK